jgi:hypothetical protein
VVKKNKKKQKVFGMMVWIEMVGAGYQVLDIRS